MRRDWKDIFNDFFTGFTKTRFWQHKLVMILLAVAMLLLVIFYAGLRAAVVTMLSPAAVTTDNIGKGGTMVENGIFRDEFIDGRVLEIKSKLSQSDSNNNDIIFLQEMHGRLLAANHDQAIDKSPANPDQSFALTAMTPSNILAPGELMNFSTTVGILTLSKNMLLLTNAVEANLVNGLKIKTTKLNINFKTGNMTGDQPIDGVGPREEFTGQGILVVKRGNEVTLLGNSTLTLFANPNILSTGQ